MKGMAWVSAACVAAVLGCGTSGVDVTGRWDVVTSHNDFAGNTVQVSRGTASLSLHDDGSFDGNGPEGTISGSYAVKPGEEPGYGPVQFLELSQGVGFLGGDSLFMVEVHSDSLHLTNPWTDSWSHVLVRSGG